MSILQLLSVLIKLSGQQTFEIYVQNEGKPDIIHAHSMFYGGYLATLLGEKYGIPVVLTEHSSLFITIKTKSSLVEQILQLTDMNLTVGTPLAKALQTYCPKNPVRVLGNSVDVDYFHPLDICLPKSPFVFSLVALLDKNKGVDNLLIAFSKIFKGKTFLLNITGDGEERDKLQRLAIELEIDSQVMFLGMLSRKEVRTLLQNSHAVISASYVETFGVNLIEAMACGKPVIATRSGGPEMFVNQNNGILVPVGDVDALAEAMQVLVENYACYDPHKIRAECVKSFSEQTIINQLEIIYQNIILKHAKKTKY